MRNVGRLIKTVSERWGVLPFLILAASALAVLGFVVLGTSLMDDGAGCYLCDPGHPYRLEGGSTA